MLTVLVLAALHDFAALCERAFVGLGRRLLDHREKLRGQSLLVATTFASAASRVMWAER
jgi:hypothetical protein